MLNAYLTSTQLLLQNPAPTAALYSPANLTSFINTARGQLAGESESIRVVTTLPVTAGTNVYPFSDIVFPFSSAVSGVEGVLAVRQVQVGVAGGLTNLVYKPFPYFNYFFLGQVVPPSDQPTHWTQYGQGATGSLYVYPTPDTSYTLALDTVCYPIPLVNDLTVEAIPYQWTDAVPFFAAFYAYMSTQRQTDADTMYQRYEQFTARARRQVTPDVLPYSYPQANDPTQANRLGIQQQRGGG